MSGGRSELLITLLIGLAAGRCLFAGREFVAGPGEQTVPNQLIVGLEPGAAINQVLASTAPQAVATFVSPHGNIYLLNLPAGTQAAASPLLAAHPLVDFVEPNRIRHATVLPPNDSLLTQQWALTTIQAFQAWSYFPDHYLTAANPGANRVNVAILDSGADCTHPDFMNAGGTSTNAAQGGQLVYDSNINQAPTGTTIPSPACSWEDDDGHGTHTAGILAAATNNATGVASLGYPLQLIVIKVLDSTGNASDSTVAAAIDTAVSAGAQVISMSLAGAGYSESLQAVMDAAWEQNVLVVAAAGNTGDTTLQYPGAGNHVLGVAATDTSNAPASFSTYGNWVKIAAPGVNIESTLPTYGSMYGTNYGALQGTSMATPFVAALGGLLYAANPGLSVAAIAQRIQQTAQTPNIGWDQHIGYGVINAGAALSGATGAATQGSLTGQVIDQLNNPVSGAVVTAGNQSFTTVDDPTTHGPDGLFRIANLSPGSYPISVAVPGSSYPTVNLQGVVVAGADTMLTIQMGVALGEFNGAVSWNGAPVAGAVVEAVIANLVAATAVTNASGNYTLYVRANTYTLTASAPNYINVASGSETLSANSTVTVNFALSALGTLTGKVTDSGGLGISNAHIDFTSAGFSGGAVTGAGGSYSTFGIPAGTYTVTASASGYNNATVSGVSVTTNTSTLVNLQFSTGVSLASGLLGHWPLSEGSGSVAHDQSGNGYNATLVDTTWTPGLFTFGLSFNGSNSEGDTPAIPLGNAFSISSWVNPAVTTEVPYAAIAETDFRTGLYLGVDPTGERYKFIVNSGAGSTGICGGPYGCAQGGAVTAGWRLVTGTYDGTTALLYVDGAVVASDTAGAPGNLSLPLEIGRSHVSAVSWDGILDDMRLYNRTLTASEVASLYGQASGPNLSLMKTADAAAVSPGTSIGYTLAVTNSGLGTATVAALNDPLPTGTGIAWSISPAYSGPGTCSIAGGTLSCSFGSLPSEAMASVHVTSATSQSSCGAYANTATLTASNNGTLQSSATTEVQCSQTITFGPLPNVPFGAPPFTVSATASSSLPVSFNSQTMPVCTVSGATVTLVAAGACTIQATQAGNTSYAPATPVNQSFQVIAPALTITKSHTGGFTQRQSGATYTVTVANTAGAGATSGTVTVTEIVPAGLTLVSMNGGMTWNCTVPPNCTTNTVLNAGTPSTITVTVNVAHNALPSVINQVSVSGGGSATAYASDPTAIAQISPCDITGNGNTTVADVQAIINEALGLAPAADDLNGGGVVNVADIQIVINAVRGLTCSGS